MDYTPSGLQVLHTLFKRCLDCPNVTPDCPTCPAGHSCVQISRTCTTCASRQCVASDDTSAPTTPSSSGGGTNVGAIVGGVVGGVVVIAIATYLIWRFCIKPRRAQYEEEYPEDGEYEDKEYEQGYRPSRLARGSTHSVRSMASTVMTRASNVIQIAFIPGITDRSGSDAALNSSVPPVPPVPLELADTQPATPYSQRQIPPSPYSDAASGDHYFMPQDLRQSRFSEFSDETDSRSTRHYSIASSLARASVGSAIYGQSTITPAQTAISTKANVVSVTSSQRATPGGTIPEVPVVDYLKYGQLVAAKNGSTTVATKDPPTDLPDTQKVQTTSSNATAVSHNTAAPPSVATATSSSGQPAAENRGAIDTPKKAKAHSAHLTAAIAEATKRASKQPTHGGLGSVPVRREQSPFGDENAVSDSVSASVNGSGGERSAGVSSRADGSSRGDEA